MMLLAISAGPIASARSQDVSEYAHTAWRVSDGFTPGYILAIAQTPDGYLWLGTDLGLLRFDGIRATAWRPRTGPRLPHEHITSLTVSRDGKLWIGTRTGLASMQDDRLTIYQAGAGQLIHQIVEARDGTIWFGVEGPGRLCAIRRENSQCYGAGEFGGIVHSLLEDSAGTLWLGTETGMWSWSAGHAKKLAKLIGAETLLGEDEGGVMIATHTGLARIVNDSVRGYSLEGLGKPFVWDLLRSSDGALWIATTQGLFHARQGRTDRFTVADGLTSDYVIGLFEDREGNVWVRTDQGLDQFRSVAVRTISTKQGLSSPYVLSVQATADGSVWIATADGLNRWQDGRVTEYRTSGAPTALGRDSIEPQPIFRRSVASRPGNETYALGVGGDGRLWISTRKGILYFHDGGFALANDLSSGVTRVIAGEDTGSAIWIVHTALGVLRRSSDGVLDPVESVRAGETEGVLAVLHDRRRDGVWLGRSSGGLEYLQHGHLVATYGPKNGLGAGRVTHLRLSPDGTLWAATEAGLSRVSLDGRITTLSSKNGLPCDGVHWSIDDEDHALWLYMKCGLVRVSQADIDAALTDTTHRVVTTIFDNFDGVVLRGLTNALRPAVTRSVDGRVWFTTGFGVHVLDPRHLPFNKLPPPVHVEHVTADDRSYDSAMAAGGVIALPPRVRNVAIEFVALSLAAPAKVRYRFKLEGQDPDWREVADIRRVEYSNLPPGTFHFRVIAANNSGVWNERGASVEFRVAPAFYQTVWFTVLMLAALIVAILALHAARVRQVERRAEEHKRADEALAGLRSELSTAMRMASLATVTASIAHEVNQPLAGVVTNAGVCQRMLTGDSPNIEGAREAARRLIRDGRRAAEVMTRVRALFTRKASAAESVDLNDATREVIALARSDIRRGGAVVHLELTEGLPRVTGDRVQLQQVILNLVRNACDAMRGVEDRPRSLLIRTEREDGDRVRVSVQDSGVGIERASMGKLFDPFYTTKAEGMGIGLSVSRSIIERHEGRLWAASNAGPGSTFVFSLPARSENSVSNQYSPL